MLPTVTGQGSPYRDLAPAPTEPPADFFAVTPSDSVNFTTRPRAIYVGTGGDVVCVNTGGTAVTLKNVLSGTQLVISPIRINLTNTTASNIVALV